ncbi:hypothetical protein DFH08DRAFT_845407 [Mycena albidolilacea]|uniref:Uncharacterized protein n=1 Tax=Mycena albidolilacea TaxID=1033008 RepID=A0AAD7AHL0_9AGAR|nr:hypothetical protein DFH08DRAFT_845407 [Mycena albidolilacea]
MDSENAPLLLDDENETNHIQAHANQPSAGRSQAQHLCSRCENELDSQSFKTTPRHLLIFAAILFCIIIFSLFVGHMAVEPTAMYFRNGRAFYVPAEKRANVITVFAAIWTQGTLGVLLLLLCMGRRRHSHHKLSRTVTQIRVLCALAVSWLFLMAGIVTLHTSTGSRCGWNGDCQRLFFAAHAFSWILIVTLFSAAYATYRRAVTVHGTELVRPPPPPMVPAWRLSGVADNERPISEGVLKI